MQMELALCNEEGSFLEALRKYGEEEGSHALVK